MSGADGPGTLDPPRTTVSVTPAVVAAAVQAVSAAVFLGGVARLVSWRVSGRPHPVLVGATALELAGIPVLVAWQKRVARLAGR